MIKEIPKEVNIDAIIYRVTEVEGMIIFSEAYGMWGECNRIIFTHPKYALWQLELKLTSPTIAVSHVCKAYQLVQEWHGDDFGREIKEN